MSGLEANANAEAKPSMTKEIGKRVQAEGYYEPSLSLYRIPACPSCGAANPKDLNECPQCGAPAPDRTDFRTVKPVLYGSLFPWYARALLWLGGVLLRFARRLQRS